MAADWGVNTTYITELQAPRLIGKDLGSTGVSTQAVPPNLRAK
jgi:hypothetical protein